MPIGKSGHAAEVINGNIYILGAVVLMLEAHLQLLRYTAQAKFLRVSIQSESL